MKLFRTELLSKIKALFIHKERAIVHEPDWDAHEAADAAAAVEESYAAALVDARAAVNKS